MKTALAIVLSLLMLAIVGCGVSRGDLVGTWDLSSKEDGATDRLQNAISEIADLHLELRDDGTASYSALGISLEGTWEFDKEGSSVKVMDTEQKISLTFLVSEDGKTLSHDRAESNLVFKKTE